MANKIDVAQDDTYLNEIEKIAEKENMELFKISATSRTGVDELIKHVAEILKELPKEDLIEVDEKIVYTLKDDEKPFEVEVNGHEYTVKGPAIERLMRKVHIQDRESMYYLQKSLNNIGVDEELRKLGIKEGDTVKITYIDDKTRARVKRYDERRRTRSL